VTDQQDNEPQDDERPPIVLVKPPKDIDEMSAEELDAFAETIWTGVKKSGD
jgi:hypothetical protein